MTFRTTMNVRSEIAKALVAAVVILAIFWLLGGIERSSVAYVMGFTVGQLVFLWSSYKRRERVPNERPL